jgi:hypothetical protein
MLQNGYIAWSGPSLIDGSPIVLILTGFVTPTSNRKTGRQIQSWILQENILPTEAALKGLDQGICGCCPLKLSQTGSCYVDGRPLNQIYRKYASGTYPKFSASEIEVLKRYRYPIRIGSYGDPTAIPIEVWEPIILASGRYTGYSHQWRYCDDEKCWQKYLMASVQSETEAKEAQLRGWRTFRIIAPDAPLSKGEILCRHTEYDRNQCENC